MYKFGVQVPRNHDQAIDIDTSNVNTLWREDEIKELKQIDEYETFLDQGLKIPKHPYKKIGVHMV